MDETASQISISPPTVVSRQADQDLPAALRENFSDIAAAVLRATLGNIPIGGALVVELIGRVLPDLREQRFLEYLARLAQKVEQSHRTLDDLLKEIGPMKAALFEDGALGAVRSTSGDRIEHLAALVALGLEGTERGAEDQRSLVRMLNELTDADLRYLMLWTAKYNGDEEWRRLNGFDYRFEWDNDKAEHVALGDTMDPVVEMYIQGRLESMGLIDKRVVHASDPMGSSRLGDKFEYETEISSQGLSLLRRLSLIGPEDGRA